MNKIDATTIPAELKAIPQWVVWIWATRDGKATKIPIDPRVKRSAAVNDPETWSDFDTAYSLATRWRTPGGIGFMFTADDPYCGVDLDKCRDPKTGEFTDGARRIIDRVGTYTEVSPSLTGAKMIVRAALMEGRNRTDGIEFYDRGRFFTITGQHVEGTPTTVETRQAEISALHAEFFPPKEQSERKRPPEMAGEKLDLDDDELIRRIRRSKQGYKFDGLMHGEHDFESESEADCALASIVGWWTGGDREQMLRIIKASRLWDEKWERPDYQRRTFDAGLAGVTDFYGTRAERAAPPAPENQTGPPPEAGDLPKRNFLWASELKAQDKNDKWLWEGYISRGGISLFSALWKAGKTTLLSHLLKAFEQDGEFCGLPVKGCKVLYITEEDQGTWADRRDLMEFGDHVGFECRPFVGRANAGQWVEFLAKVKQDVEDYKFDLVIFDTLGKLWPVKDENSASQVDEALMPLWPLAGTGAGLLLVHHFRKGDGADATGSRGSGALTAFVETIIELRRFESGNQKDTRRVLTAHGRYPETPDELVIKLTDDGYVAMGDRETCNIAKVRRAAVHPARSDLCRDCGRLAGGCPADQATPSLHAPGRRGVWPLDGSRGRQKGRPEAILGQPGCRDQVIRFWVPFPYTSRTENHIGALARKWRPCSELG